MVDKSDLLADVELAVERNVRTKRNGARSSAVRTEAFGPGGVKILNAQTSTFLRSVPILGIEVEVLYVSVLKELRQANSVVGQMLLLSTGDDFIAALSIGTEDLQNEWTG